MTDDNNVVPLFPTTGEGHQDRHTTPKQPRPPTDFEALRERLAAGSVGVSPGCPRPTTWAGRYLVGQAVPGDGPDVGRCLPATPASSPSGASRYDHTGDSRPDYLSRHRVLLPAVRRLLYPCLDTTRGRPFGVYIHGNDGTEGASGVSPPSRPGWVA